MAAHAPTGRRAPVAKRFRTRNCLSIAAIAAIAVTIRHDTGAPQEYNALTSARLRIKCQILLA